VEHEVEQESWDRRFGLDINPHKIKNGEKKSPIGFFLRGSPIGWDTHRSPPKKTSLKKDRKGHASEK